MYYIWKRLLFKFEVINTFLVLGLASLIGLGMVSPNPAFTTMTTTLALSGKHNKNIFRYRYL